MFNQISKLMAVGVVMSVMACSEQSADHQKTASAPESVRTLDTSKTYIVATDASYAPMEYMDNNQVVGFSHDVLDEAAKSQNVKLKFINVPFDSLFPHVRSGDSDIGLASITINDDRKRQLDFSDPYFVATQQIITNENNSNNIKSLQDLKNRVVSVQSATSADLILQDLQGKQSKKIKRFDVMPLAFQELENGGVDAVMGDSSVVSYYIKQHPEVKFNSVIDPSFIQEHYGFAFKKGRDDGLREAINKGLAQIKADGTYQKIEQRWFGSSSAEAMSASAVK